MPVSTISRQSAVIGAFEFTWPIVAALFATFGLVVFFTTQGMQPHLAMLHATTGMALFVVAVVVPLRIIDTIRHLRSLALLGSMGLNVNALADVLIQNAAAMYGTDRALESSVSPDCADVGRR